MRMFAILGIFVASLFGCRRAPPTPEPAQMHRTGSVDVNGAGSTVTISGAISTTTDAGNSQVGIVGNPGVDTTPGDLNTVWTHFVQPVTCGVFAADAGPGTFVAANIVSPATNTLSGYVQFFCGQTGCDAGGLNDGGVVATMVTPYLAPGQSANLTEVQVCYDGGIWQGASTVATVRFDAGVPSFGVDVGHR